MNKVIPLLTFSILLLIPVSQDAFANHTPPFTGTTGHCDFKTNRPFPGVDYWNCDLNHSGSPFSNDQDLTGANLSGVDLSFTTLTGVILSDANLFGINLFTADLAEADLSGADLTNANLIGASLLEVDLSGANLFGADLFRASLIRADLTGASLTDADLTDAELTEADLTGASLFDADLTDADLTDADLTGANLFGADLTGADLTNANLNCLNHPICLSDNEPPLTCGPNTFESGGECIPIAELVFCGEHTEEILGFCVPILAELCSTGTMIDMGVCTAQAMGSMIGGWLLDIDTTALLVASIGTNPVITTLMGITIAGVAGQAVWFVHKRKKKVE